MTDASASGGKPSGSGGKASGDSGVTDAGSSDPCIHDLAHCYTGFGNTCAANWSQVTEICPGYHGYVELLSCGSRHMAHSAYGDRGGSFEVFAFYAPSGEFVEAREKSFPAGLPIPRPPECAGYDPSADGCVRLPSQCPTDAGTAGD